MATTPTSTTFSMGSARKRAQRASTAAAQSDAATSLWRFLPAELAAAIHGHSASEWAVWLTTAVLCVGAYARHGLLAATVYFLSTAGLCAIDQSMHSVQLLNLAAVVYDLSFELHRLYTLVSNRPLLMMVIMVVALGVEWLLERYEAEDASDSASRGALGGLARLGRSVGRMLLPAVMGVLIACVGWLALTAALLHPSAFSAPMVEAIEQMLGARFACASAADCVYVTGSAHQVRVHGVYVRSPRRCSDKPVYRQRGPEGLYLHSPAHENQWNVGPDVCDNSPRNKWMELYSPAASAEDIGAATWFEYADCMLIASLISSVAITIGAATGFECAADGVPLSAGLSAGLNDRSECH